MSVTKNQMPLIAAAEQEWLQNHADMLLSFDRAQLVPAITAWGKLEGQNRVSEDDDEDDFYVLTSQCFVELYLRQAITPVRPLSTRGDQQLQSLLQLYGKKAAAERTPEDPDAQFKEVAAMHKTLSSAELKAWLNEVPERWGLHEEAAIRGLI